MATVSAVDLSCPYSVLAALREAGFSNQRVYKAMACLYDEPEPNLDGMPEYFADDADVPDDEWPAPDEPYEPSEADWLDYQLWAERLEFERNLHRSYTHPALALTKLDEPPPSGSWD